MRGNMNKLYTLSASFWRWLIGSEALSVEELQLAKDATVNAYHRAKCSGDRRMLAREIAEFDKQIKGLT
jgi:hypothetical protein